MALIQVHDRALRALGQRIAARKDELARRTVGRFREEVVGFQNADEPGLADTVEFVRRNIDSLVSGLERAEPIDEQLLDMAREVAARRAHQGVSLDSMLHQGRVWGETIWESVLAEADIGRPDEREAALQIAGRLWRHVDVLATAMAHAYLDEMTDRGLMGRDLLDALLGGQGDDERVRRLARMLRRRLGENHVVVLIRGDAVPKDDSRPLPLATAVAVDQIVDAARTYLRPAAGSLLVGIRLGDVVAIYPASDPGELDTIRRECAALADGITVDVSIGMSGWHTGRPAISTAHAEAREAVEIAAGMGIRGRAVVLDDVLVDYMLRASPHARRILEGTMRPLVEYDRRRRAELVQTLRAYLSAGTNLTKSARLLTVHPNTVVYRLRRIRELCGRDPHSMEDLQILFLALKLSELTSGDPDGS